MRASKFSTIYMPIILVSVFLGILATQLTPITLISLSFWDVIKNFFPIATSLILFLTFTGFFAILINNKNLKIASYSLITVIFFATYALGSSSDIITIQPIISTTILFILAIIAFDRSINTAYSNQIQPKLKQIIKNSSSSFLKGFALLLALNFYLTNNQPAMAKMYKEKFITDLSNSTSNIVKKQMKIELDKTGVIPTQDSQNVLQDLLTQGTNQTAININQLNINSLKNLANKPSLSEGVIETQVKQEVANFVEPYSGVIIPIFSIIYFFSLMALFSVITLFIPPFVAVVEWTLKEVGLIKSLQEAIQVTRITF